MTSLELFRQYLAACQRQLRRRAFWTGAALTALIAVLLTLALVWWTNRLAFSASSLFGARFVLFVSLGLALALGIVVPLLRLNRRRAARAAEQAFPDFNQRLITLEDRSGEDNPFHELLARDVVKLADEARPERLVRPPVLWGSAAAALGGAALLLWLILAAPGYLGHGASLLWAGAPRPGLPPMYQIEVTPGSHKVRRGADQLVQARLLGFDTPRVMLWARYQGASKWESLPMTAKTSGNGYDFLFAGLNDSVDYYVQAGNVKSGVHTLTVVNLPAVRRVRVTYHYPGWAGLRDATEDPGGDLRAVEGTVADVEIETDRPLTRGTLSLEPGEPLPLQALPNNRAKASVTIRQDGTYHVAAIDDGEEVRLTEDYFIEVRKEHPPVVRISRPGRDSKVSPIEEVTVDVEGSDDFALEQMELHYSVNGGAEKTVPLLSRKGAAEARGSHMIALEDYKLVPGDILAMYATARDSRNTTKTDIFFLEAQPFEKEFQQAQTGGGEGGGGGGERENISRRQKEIIAATWNLLRTTKSRSELERDGVFLAGQQEKLAAQALSLAKRMRSRELAGANQEFQAFATHMETAAKAMNDATDQLRTLKMRDALPPEQRALQSLLRAESIFRQIQVAFGRQGGGEGGASRDLENLFDLELDTEKNQYETSASSQSQSDRNKAVDEALKRLEELARRQQELAQQQDPKKRQSFEQRWSQEMLRREAEELKRRMEELQQGQQDSQSQSQQGQSQSSSQSQQGRSLRAMAGQGRQDERLQRAAEQLERATEDMRRAAGAQGDSADARKAADRLKDASSQLGGMRRQEAGSQLDELSRRADQLAESQKNFANRLEKAFGSGEGSPRPQNAPNQDEANRMAREKAALQKDLEGLESDMKAAARSLEGSQRGAASKLRDALGEMQQKELKLRMQLGADYLKKGYGPFLAPREKVVTSGLERLRDQVREAQQALGPGSAQGKDSAERALDQLERLRQQMGKQQAQNRPGQPGQQQGQGQEGQQGRQGQSGQGQTGQGERASAQGGDSRGSIESGARGGVWHDNTGAMNRGDLPAPERRPGMSPGDYDNLVRAYGDAQRELTRLREDSAGDPETRKAVDDLIRRMQSLDPKRFPGNPALLDRLTAGLLPEMQELELKLRRQLEGSGGSGVRTGAGDKVPDGYADKVAEYFRKLSGGK